MRRMAIYFLFFASGAAALIYEVLWVRVLGLSLGVTVYATSLVLMAYMGGLSAGSAVIGRYIDKQKNGILPAYALLECAIGLSALAVSLVFIQISRVGFLNLPYGILYPAVFGLLLVPTFFMGGTLPIMSKFMVRIPAMAGKDTGTLYALNTLGGVIGCFGAGFILIRTIGVHESLYVGVVINILIAIAAIVLAKTMNVPAVSDTATLIPKKALEQGPHDRPAIQQWTIPILFGISGFCSLGYEILWTRALMFKIGNDTYAFSLMLGVFLFGLALGSLVFAKIPLDRKKSGIALGALQLAIALTVALGIGFLYRMDLFIDTLWLRLGKTWFSAIGARGTGALVLMGIPTLLMGGIFPLVIRVYAPSLQRLGKSVGMLYSVNTAGTILGTAVAGFAILPMLGITRGILLLTCINVLAGLAFLFVLSNRKTFYLGFACAAVFVPLCIMSTRHTPLPLTAAHLGRSSEKYELLYYREGVTATVSVARAQDKSKMLNVNGVYTAFTTVGDMQVHYMLGTLPYLFCGNPRDALVIGLGLGVTSASLAAAGVRVDCVELAREEIGSSPFLADVNGNVLSNRNFNLIIDDGRHHLLRTRRTYDIITSNAVHVRMSPYLYTQEFYRLCRDRLQSDGAVCQWLPTNKIPLLEFKQLIAAFYSVFPHTTVWYVNPGHFLLLGTKEKLVMDCDRMKQRMQPPLGALLKTVNLENPAIVASLLLMDESNVSDFIKNAVPHTDNHPAAEFVRVIESMTHDCLTIPPEFCINKLPLDARCGETNGKEFQTAFAATMQSRAAETAVWDGKLSVAVDVFRKALAIYPDDSRTLYLKKNAEARIIAAMLHKGDGFAIKHDFINAANEYRQAMSIDSGFYAPYACMGILYKTLLGQGDSARIMLKKAKDYGDSIANNHVNLAMLLLEQGDLSESLQEFERAVQLDTANADALFGKGFCLYRLGNAIQARPFLEQAMAKGIRKEYAEIIHGLLGE
jgi:spermidine synthase